MDYKYKPTKALYKISKVIKQSKDLAIIMGGAGAGKTISIDMLLIDAFNRNPELQITICSFERTKLMDTNFVDFKKIAIDWGLWEKGRWNENKSKFTFNHGQTGFIEFIGLDKADVGKGRRRDYIYINECNKISHDKFVDITLRAKKTIADYNPDNEFYINEYITDKNYIILTHLDNEYLPEEERNNILNYALKGFHDPYLPINELIKDINIKNKYWANKYKVYGLGLQGSIEGVIFNDWERADQWPEHVPHVYGLDWGSSVPFALIKVGIDEKKKKVYVEEKCYKPNLSTSEIITICKDRANDSIIIADSADRRGIMDLIQAKINARPAYKPNVVSRIRALQSYTLVFINSPNVEKEREKYLWIDGKADIPIDDFNHAFDAIGYAFVYLRRKLF